MKHARIVVILTLCLALTGLGTGCASDAQKPVVQCGDFTMDNTDLAYYYWSEFFYYKEVFEDYLREQVDFSRPLEDQLYEEGCSWQDYMLENALETVCDTMTMVFAAEKEGFALPADYDGQYQQQLVDFTDAAIRAGCDDLEEYLRDSYGRKATRESFSRYLYNTHLAAAYADHLLEEIAISDEQVRQQFERHQEDYTAVYGFDPEDPDTWMEPIRRELQNDEYQNRYRRLRSGYSFRINRSAIRLQPPKGLYE